MGKKSKGTVATTVYGNTTTSNPYFTSKTTNDGTTSIFNPNTAFDTINNFVNSNMDSILNQYLNPTLNSTTNRTKLNSFINTLNNESAKNFENNIINPLSKRNMIRSSQATDLYNNMLNSNTNAISNYTNDLLANSQKEMGEVLGKLLAAYVSGYSALADTQKQSLATSKGNATTSNPSNNTGFDMSQMINLATSLALAAL